MKDVKIRTDELLKAVTKNRDEHVTQLELAKQGYRLRVIQEMKKRLGEIEAGGPINLHFRGHGLGEDGLIPPQDHTADYDKVIRMLEMTVDSEVTLDSTQFDHYVMDNWTWAAMTKSLNASYTQALN